LDLRAKMKKIVSASVFLLVSVITFLLGPKSYGQDALTDSIISARLQFLQKSLKTDEHKTSLWWNGWLYGYSALTLGQGVVFVTADNLSTRQDMALGAATSLLGFKRTIWDGLENFAINTAITEAQIWSQPIRAKKDYQNYFNTFLNDNYPTSNVSKVNWVVGVFSGGATIYIVF